MKKLIGIKNKDDAIVGIVTAFLIVGLMVTVVSVIQTVYIPKWMEQQEAEHMEEVGNQFAQLKYAIGQHILSKQKGVPISTSITLGSKELPFLMSSRAFGTLSIVKDRCTITVLNSTTNFSVDLGVIEYSSANAYYLNQDFIYEAGAVILNQREGNTMVIRPSFQVEVKENNVNISFIITNITTVAGKNIISGFGTYPIQTDLADYNDNIPLMVNVSNITIATKYENAWHRFINATLKNQHLTYGTEYEIFSKENGITIEFDESISVLLDIKLIKINAQVAPGWIENI